MYPFVAFLWSAHDPEAKATAAQWAQQLCRACVPWENLVSTDSIAVFALSPTDPTLRAYMLPDETGVVLGKLFSADLSKPSVDSVGQIDERAAREIIRSGGQHLVQNFWGGYVAFLADRRAGCGYAIRDCSGKIPCY